MGQNRFSENLIFKRFAAKVFSEVSRRVKKDSVNLTFNAVLHRKILSRYVMVPWGPQEELQICI